VVGLTSLADVAGVAGGAGRADADCACADGNAAMLSNNRIETAIVVFIAATFS
jgi:hypothetical protein